MVNKIQLSEPGEFIAAVPGFLGFTPSESVVIITFTGNTHRQLHCAIRMDLPQPGHTTGIVARLCDALAKQPITGAVIVVVSDADKNSDLPFRELLTEFRLVTPMLGIELIRALWVDRIELGRPWRCYDDALSTGLVPDPRASQLAAMRVAEGEVTYDSREDLATQLAADPPSELNRRAAQLRQLTPTSATDALDVVRDAVNQIDADGHGAERLDEDRIVRLVQALTVPTVRSESMQFALGGQAAAAERLWSLLARAAPRPEATHPATLLAISSALRGEGALANIAIDVALTADPSNRTAGLLRTVLAEGMSPAQLRQAVATSLTAGAPTERSSRG